MGPQHRHFLQTEAWGAFQKALGRSIITASGDGWHWMAIVERGRLGTRLYCPYGPTATTAAALHQGIQSLKDTARENGAVFVRIEPVTPIKEVDLRDIHAVHAPRDVQPAHTWRVDLTQSEADIIAGMNATNRNLHRTAHKKGISFRKSSNPNDISILLEFIHEVARRTGIRPHSDTYFRLQTETLLPRKAAYLFFADFQGKPIAAAFVYDSDTIRYYAHAGSSYAHRKLHTGTPLVSHMMLEAKASGLNTFDFYGIAPPNAAHHPWAGFTSFKQSFGGYQHNYPGTWDLPLKSLPYRMYRLALHIADATPHRV